MNEEKYIEIVIFEKKALVAAFYGFGSSIGCTIEIKLEFKFASQVKFPPPQHSSKIMYLYLIRMLQRNTSKTCHTLGSWNYEKPM